MNSYSIYTTAQALYKWRTRLCAGVKDKKPAPLLATCWDSKTKKLRFTLMLPQLTRHVLRKWSTMYGQLQVAVHALPMAAVTGPSPTKAKLKKMNIDLVAENDALSALNADLQSTIEERYVHSTMYHRLVPAHRIFPRTFLGFFCICCLISCDFHDPLSGARRGQRAKEAHV